MIRNKVLLWVSILALVSILLTGCDISKIGKTCTQECIRQETYCASNRQECVEKNFWGNCVEYEEVCAQYDQKCAEYGEVCK